MKADDAVNLLWQEWQYRHELYWKSLYRWGGAVVAVSVVPYVKTDTLCFLGQAVLVFPIVAFLLAAAGAWHLAAEYARLNAVGKKYDELRAPFLPPGLEGRIVAWSIGKVATRVFAIGLTALSVANAVVLMGLAAGAACT